MKLRRSLLPCLLLLMLGVAIGDQHPPSPADNHSREFRSMQAKLAYLKQNAAKPHPDPKPTDLTEAEVNAYFNEGGVKLPKGVSHVRLTSQPGVIDAHAQIDFEAITKGRGSNNPLYSLFSGTHDIHAVAPGQRSQRHRQHSRADNRARRRGGAAVALAAVRRALHHAQVSQRRHDQHVQAAAAYR